VCTDTKVGQLVCDDVVDERRREHHRTPVETERAARCAASPADALVTYQVPIYSPPDTVADYFKYGNKI